jgi:pimeloyl-ACP methyl ester carboxylesterase
MSPTLLPRSAATLVAALALAFIPARAPAQTEDVPAEVVKVDVGQIAGARYAIAVPAGIWNHRLLLLAHGYRPESAPLIADLNPQKDSIKVILEAGWMVATTSFRRNGMVIADAIEDLDALRDHIAKQYGETERVILEGESLGGLIVTIMAERDKGAYDGAIALDPTMYLAEPNGQLGLSLLPRIPLLFVATQKEALQPMRYRTALVARPPPVIQPVLFLIQREGHTNINQAEHLEAFEAINTWIDRGVNALPQPKDQTPYFDATIVPDPVPSTATVRKESHAFDTRVAEADPVYGNVLLEAVAQDFDDAGIAPMTYCTVEVGGKSYRTLYGRTYADVKQNEWVAFPDADGRTVLARYFGDAVATAGLKPGTPVTLTAVEPGPPPSH